MNPTRLLAAVFAATGLFLAFPPGTASANDITAGSATCSSWSVAWTHFPSHQDVALDVSLELPSGTTATGQAFTHGEPSGTASGSWELTEAGQAHLTVAWTLATRHVWETTVDLTCEPPTTTTTIPVTPPTTTPPSSAPPAELAPPLTAQAAPAAPAPELPVGTPELAYTGSRPELWIGGLVALVLGGVLLWTSRSRG